MFGNDFLFLHRFLKSLGHYERELDRDFGPLTDSTLNKFELEAEKIASAFGRYDQRSERNIGMLHIKAQKSARHFLRAVGESAKLNVAGVMVRIISGTRTYQKQSERIAQGRSKPGRVVTKAGPGRSNHNFSIAWELGSFRGTDYLNESPLYDTFGMIGKTLGFEWSGDWSSIIDKPHFQLKTESALSELRIQFDTPAAFVKC